VSASANSSSEQRSLLAAARRMLNPDPYTAGMWPRGAALLTRQAIECALDVLWRQRAPGVERCSMRAQLLCLGHYLRQGDLAEEVAYAWTGLSRACHHHVYELPPTAAELHGWMEIAQDLVNAVGPSA
jgi:hypothetical protein